MGPDQVLIISPSNSITFEGTFKDVLAKKITMKNPLDKYVAFKIKTTTPKQYCVRPSLGYIAPEQTKEISIMLQPLLYTLSEKAKHKFMIQSIIISEDDISNIDLVWKNAPASGIMSSKLLSVLIQTNDIAQSEEKKLEESSDHVVDDMMSFNDSEEHLLEEEVTKEMFESGDASSKEVIDSNVVAFTEIMNENVKLKDQVATLKKIVFDNTYKWESLQAEPVNDKEDVVRAGVSYDQSCMREALGLPTIVYQLIAFFLGLILGKFIL